MKAIKIWQKIINGNEMKGNKMVLKVINNFKAK